MTLSGSDWELLHREMDREATESESAGLRERLAAEPELRDAFQALAGVGRTLSEVGLVDPPPAPGPGRHAPGEAERRPRPTMGLARSPGRLGDPTARPGPRVEPGGGAPGGPPHHQPLRSGVWPPRRGPGLGHPPARRRPRDAAGGGRGAPRGARDRRHRRDAERERGGGRRLRDPLRRPAGRQRDRRRRGSPDPGVRVRRGAAHGGSGHRAPARCSRGSSPPGGASSDWRPRGPGPARSPSGSAWRPERGRPRPCFGDRRPANKKMGKGTNSS